jgi:micrococcal nuclease
MRRRGTLLLVVALLGAVVLGGGRPGSSNNSPPRGDGSRIERVVDGDTVVVTGLDKARLIGVDTPEVHGGAECFGREASAYVKRLLPAGTPVRYRLGTEPRDRYGRALVHLFLRDGRHVNELLVRDGYAQPLTIPPNVEYADRFVALARAARRAGRGLWGVCKEP